MSDVIKSDPTFAGGALKCHDHGEQLNMLSQVLTAKGSNGESLDAFLEGDDPEDLVTKQHAGSKSGARRAIGNMAALSGGAGLMYLEYGSGGSVGQKVRAQERAEKTKGMRKKLGVL
jgi:DNA excision repair protein ERCC-3